MEKNSRNSFWGMIIGCFTIISGCEKEPLPLVSPPPPISVESHQQFQGVIDGDSVSIVIESQDQAQRFNSHLSGGGADTTYYTCRTTLSENFSGGSGDRITVVKKTFAHPDTGQPTRSDWASFFATGSHPFATDSTDGVRISYYDDDQETFWKTSNGSGNQNGSSFTIADTLFWTGPLGTEFIKIHAGFNCTFYDNNGNQASVTNAQFVGSFIVRHNFQ